MLLNRHFQVGTAIVRTVLAISRNEPFGVKENLDRLSRLGGVYIKFLQVLALSLPPKNRKDYKELLSVYEHSRPDDINIINYLGAAGTPLEQFAHIEPQPFATGSFGQVYEAALLSGERVAIKVLRPSVIRALRSDLSLLRFVSSVYSLIDKKKMVDFHQVYREFKISLRQETNYLREAWVADYYYQAYRDSPRITIPKTYLSLCNKKVIVQDLVEGLSLAKVLEAQTNGHDANAFVRSLLGSDLRLQLKTAGTEFLGRALGGEVVQTDPHPGNILLLPQNKIALIDFGMATELQGNRTALYELLLQWQAYYSNSLAIEEFTLAAIKYLAPNLFAALKQADRLLGDTNNKIDLLNDIKQATKAIGDEQQQLIQSLLEKRMILKALLFVVNKNNRFGLSLDLSAIAFFKAAQTYLSLVGQFEGSSEIIADMLQEVVDNAQLHFEQLVDESTKKELKPAEALEILCTWFDKMARNDPWLMNDLVGEYIK